MAQSERPGAREGATAVTRDDVHSGLSRVIASPQFQRSHKLRELLKYLVEKELSGQGPKIKGYSIAIDVLERGSDFDPQTDSAVRVLIGRLRQALEHYYGGQGRKDRLRIEVPVGSYRPVFHVPAKPPNSDDTKNADGFVGINEKASTAPLAFRRAPWFSLTLALAFLIGAFLWLNQRESDKIELRFDDPRVAILPFANVSNDPTNDVLAQGLSFNLVNELARFSWLSVFVDRLPGGRVTQSTDEVRARFINTVDYTLEGTVDQSADTIVIAYRLVDAKTGKVKWVNTFTRPLSATSLYGIQKEAAIAIALETGQPEGVVKKLEQARARANKTKSLTAYLCVLKIYEYWRVFSSVKHLETRNCLEAAIEKERNYAEAYAALAFIYLDERRYKMNPRSGYDPYRRGLEAAEKATKLDPFSAPLPTRLHLRSI